MRVSVGIEHVSDLIGDLDEALEAVSARQTDAKPAEREHAGRRTRGEAALAVGQLAA